MCPNHQPRRSGLSPLVRPSGNESDQHALGHSSIEMKIASVNDRQVDVAPDRDSVDGHDRSTGRDHHAGRVSRASWVAEHLRRRRWPLLVMLTFVVVSMAYSLWWNPVVHHSPVWVIPGDIWSTFRAAHWVGWGDIGAIYGKDTQLVTFPGIAVLLAPVAMVSGALGLGESLVPIILSRPTSWLLLGPAILLVGSTCLVAVDAMAEELGVSGRRRIVLSLMEAVVIFQVVTMWGHPEDLVALAFSLYALLAMFRGRWSLSGWLWGAAIVLQPLVVLMFPLAFVRTPGPHRLRLCLTGRPPFGRAPQRAPRDAVAPDVGGPLPSGERQVPRSCDALGRPVARAVTDRGRRRARSDDRRPRRRPDRLPGLSEAAVDRRPPVAVRPGPQPPLLLRIGDGRLLPRTSAGAHRADCRLLCRSAPPRRCLADRHGGDRLRLPRLVGVGLLGPDGGLPGHRAGLCVARPRRGGDLR